MPTIENYPWTHFFLICQLVHEVEGKARIAFCQWLKVVQPDNTATGWHKNGHQALLLLLLRSF